MGLICSVKLSIVYFCSPTLQFLVMAPGPSGPPGLALQTSLVVHLPSQSEPERAPTLTLSMVGQTALGSTLRRSKKHVLRQWNVWIVLMRTQRRIAIFGIIGDIVKRDIRIIIMYPGSATRLVAFVRLLVSYLRNGKVANLFNQNF